MWRGMSSVTLIAVLALLGLTGCARSRVTERTVVDDGSGTITERTTVRTGYRIEELERTWRKEWIYATGESIVGDRYDDQRRNKALAKRGARLDAERNLVEQIYTVRIDARTTMRDLDTEDLVVREVSGGVAGVEVVSEDFDEELGMWTVEVRMPKIELVRYLRESGYVGAGTERP